VTNSLNLFYGVINKLLLGGIREGLEGSPIGASIKQGRGINKIKKSAFLLPFLGQLGVSHAHP